MAPSFFFSGPTLTLQADDEGDVIDGCLAQREELIREVERCLVLRQSGAGVVVGAVPFGEGAPVRLFRPTRLLRTGRWAIPTSGAPSLLSSDARRRNDLVSQPAPQAEPFIRAVRGAVEQIQRGTLRKVVLSRVRDVPLTQAPNPQRLLRRLRAKNPHGFTFALQLGRYGERAPKLLLGASPELLVSRRGLRFVSSPLAGSAPRSLDSVEDQTRAARLLRSAKDRHEHQLVVEQIVEDLRPLAKNLRCEREPTVVTTAALHHLSTRIVGTLRDPSVSALRLALALHPTPAVCGTPTAAARSFIREQEAFDRGYFTGTLGHVDANGDGDWIVTIRCAELSAESARVFAGAGIVESSVAELELNETNVKMQTMLEALGVEAFG